MTALVFQDHYLLFQIFEGKIIYITGSDKNNFADPVDVMHCLFMHMNKYHEISMCA